MRVLGVDPGLTRCGLGVVEGVPGRATLVAVGVVRTPADAPLGERLVALEREFESWLDLHRPDAVAVERVFAQSNVRTVMGTAQAGAVAVVCAARRGLPVALHTPSEVKASVTGSGRADKEQVGLMVARLLRLDGPPRPADAADALALARWVADSAEHLGGLDIVVSNVSALAIPDSEENWQASFEIDLMGAVRLVTAAMPHLLNSDAAVILAISSVSGREIDFAVGPYGTMKAALVHYIQGLAHQLAGQGIRANTVSPGNTFFEGGVWDQIREGNPELYAAALALNPTGRMGTPKEMARAVVFLASPLSSFTSGTNLVVDGALTRGVQF